MIDNLAYSMNDIFEEVVARGREQGVVTEIAYNDLVEEVIEEKRGVGEIHDDSSTEGFEELFKNRWPAYREALGLEDKNVQL